MRDNWCASSAKSSSVLRWVLIHSSLRFQLFDSTWWCKQERGTQQGGSHSPTLFGRAVAGRFQELADAWQARGELPAYHADRLLLWALWFIDDAILVFRSPSQLARLLPEALSLLRCLGLSVNVAKSCLFAQYLPAVLPACVAGFSVRSWSTYLGQTIRLLEDDTHMVNSLCSRATCAFFANRLLLTCRSAPRARKLQLFNALVTASIRWSLGVVSVKQSSLRSLRVHFVTLLTWLLGGRSHNSWFQVECIQALRHAVKLWGRTFAEPWDVLLARMVWRWVGHTLRKPATSLVRSVLTNLRNTHGLSRNRTGPNNSGHRNVLRYMVHRGLCHSIALDRAFWRAQEQDWLAHNGLASDPAGNVVTVAEDCYLWERRCLQGNFHG